jgi:hypothetical protein
MCGHAGAGEGDAGCAPAVVCVAVTAAVSSSDASPGEQAAQRHALTTVAQVVAQFARRNIASPLSRDGIASWAPSSSAHRFGDLHAQRSVSVQDFAHGAAARPDAAQS